MKDYVIGAFALFSAASVPTAWHAGDVDPMVAGWLEQERVRTIVQGLTLLTGDRATEERLALESSAQR